MTFHAASLLQCQSCSGAVHVQPRAVLRAPCSRRQRLRVVGMAKKSVAAEGPRKFKGFGPEPPQKQEAPKPSQAASPAQSRLKSSPQAPPKQQGLPLSQQPQPRGPSDDAARVTVGDRILPRILLFSGVPLVLAMGSLPGFAYLNKVANIDVPPIAVYVISGGLFGLALAGISYGIFSTSWDPTREGSLSGLDEFKENLPVYLNKDDDDK
eukprot:CAMPEP_0206144308 /NCGR_PEP_ID=MMETSP1473-20131121/23692_1 /ASSEMBLY_ACC=CAM_ASM_001109 /TAXON_ID=1461547 /ORGANISM="Stichococcus sp, Strain RCC1054" /LENGTH=209 /DNA_ID=CAMNT_0053540097 /DNA_START=63 /DNA_END=692 /DNA_ORIENTATION=+